METEIKKIIEELYIRVEEIENIKGIGGRGEKIKMAIVK